MIGNALFAASVCLLAALLNVMETCTFLVPFRQLIWQKYSGTIAGFASLKGADVIDMLLIVSLIPLALAVAGVFGYVRGLAG